MDSLEKPKGGIESKNAGSKIIVYPFIFAIFPIVALFTANLGQVSPVVFAVAVFITLIATAGVFLAASLLLRSQEKGALFACWFVLFFFLYGSFSEVMLKMKFGDFVFARNLHRVLLYSLLALIVGYGFLRLHKSFRQLSLWMNKLSSWLLLVMILTLGWRCFSNAGQHVTLSAREPSREKPIVATEALPDIYYIILDGYAGEGTLSKYFGYDNLPFLRDLQNKGFYVPKRARSNYTMTSLSIPSSLGMDYWQHGNAIQAPPNKVKEFVEEHGYRYITISSMDPSLEDQFKGGHSSRGLLYNSFMLRLLRTTVLDAFAMRLRFYADSICDNVLESLEQLKKAPELSGRKFVFAHIVSPHPPYVFKANGERRSAFSGASLTVYKTSWDDKEGYVEQVRFINEQAREAVDTILRKSKTPPIIILQGDHGPNLSAPDQDTSADMLMHILNAYYLPGGAESALYDTITPVNSFRVIFNHCFHAGFPVLEDKCYYSTLQTPHRFVDVTAQF